MNKKGFTLVELIAVIAIIAIIATLAIPNMISMLNRSKNEKFITDAKQIIAKAKYYYKNHRTEISDGEEVTLSTLINVQGLKLESSPYGENYDADASKVIIDTDDLKFSIYLTDGTYCINNKAENALEVEQGDEC